MQACVYSLKGKLCLRAVNSGFAPNTSNLSKDGVDILRMLI